jgi:hypothetical protein
VVALGDGSVDDLALDLDAQPWDREPLAVRAALDELLGLLDAMSGGTNADLWTREALAGSERQQIREAARRVLASRALGTQTARRAHLLSGIA